MSSTYSQRHEYLPPELHELRLRVETLPEDYRREFRMLCDRLTAAARRQNRLVATAQEAVDQLQLDIKYLHFDLEATRRERDVLRGQLESQ